MLAGPYGSMLLADMGAEVIKIEDPDGGDPTRVMGPPFLADGESAYFLAINRSKKSVALDLTRDAGREVFYRSEEHTSELQSQSNLVCRLLLEKKKTTTSHTRPSHTPSLTPCPAHSDCT